MIFDRLAKITRKDERTLPDWPDHHADLRGDPEENATAGAIAFAGVPLIAAGPDSRIWASGQFLELLMNRKLLPRARRALL
jgi:hypothetical protein